MSTELERRLADAVESSQHETLSSRKEQASWDERCMRLQSELQESESELQASRLAFSQLEQRLTESNAQASKEADDWQARVASIQVNQQHWQAGSKA